MKQHACSFFSLSSILVLLSLNVAAQSAYKNIQLDDQSSSFYPPCEPSIAINTKNPAQIVAGAILDKVYFSSDTGKTWMSSKLESKFGVYGDPCVISGRKGLFYYLHLSNPDGGAHSSEAFLDRIVIQTSKDGGKSWTNGSSIGHHPTKDQDKEWAVLSPNGKKLFCTWTQFDKYESKVPGDSSVILFSQSSCKAKKWSKPVRINHIAGDCLDDDQTVEGAVPAIGPDGEIYVAWAHNESVLFDRSLDGGKSWMEIDKVIGEVKGGWNHDIPGIFRCNGMPVTACDVSGGSFNGNIYVCWADQRNGTTDTDVWISFSSDRGTTWSKSIRVNDDVPGKHQFFPWLAVDQTTGKLYVVFYDRRNYQDTRTDVYVASSSDGGKTWLNEKVSDSPFVPDASVFFGDYNNISAHDGIVAPIWTRCDQSRTSIWTTIMKK